MTELTFSMHKTQTVNGVVLLWLFGSDGEINTEKLAAQLQQYIKEKTGVTIQYFVPDSYKIYWDIFNKMNGVNKAFHAALSHQEFFKGEVSDIVRPFSKGGFNLRQDYTILLEKIFTVSSKKSHFICPFCNGTGEVVAVLERYPCICTEKKS